MADTSDQQLHDILANYPQIELAILFGSLANGRATLQSDLDLAVQADKPLDVGLKMALIGDLAETFGRPVDLVDLRTAGEPLLGQIFRGGASSAALPTTASCWRNTCAMWRTSCLTVTVS